MADGWCPFAERINGVTTFQPGGNVRVGFCDHTAGGFYSTLRSAAFWNGQGVSTHFGISRKGEVCQMVSILDTAFAQGRLGPTVTWAPYAAMNRDNPNLYLISTEHEDVETVNGQTRYIPGSQWTEAQYAADLKVKRWCIEEIKRVTHQDLMHFGLDSLAGHHMFDGVNRAECPGRYWRDEYRARLFADLTGTTEEIMQRFNSIAPRLQGQQASQVGPVTLADFNPSPPAGTKRLRIEVYVQANASGRVEVKDSDGKYAGQVGWDGARYGVVEVDVSSGQFTVDGVATLAQVGIVGIA